MCCSSAFPPGTKTVWGASVVTGRVQGYLCFPVPDLSQNSGSISKAKPHLGCQWLNGNLETESSMTNTSHPKTWIVLGSRRKHTQTLV